MAKKKSLRKASQPVTVECYYTIETVAQLLSLPPQTIRYYEEQGIIQSKNLAPAQKAPKLYSRHDIEILKRVRHLTEELGVNLPGVEIILHLLEQIEKENK